jgi:hypothetical protein
MLSAKKIKGPIAFRNLLRLRCTIRKVTKQLERLFYRFTVEISKKINFLLKHIAKIPAWKFLHSSAETPFGQECLQQRDEGVQRSSINVLSCANFNELLCVLCFKCRHYRKNR